MKPCKVIVRKNIVSNIREEEDNYTRRGFQVTNYYRNN